MYTLRFNHRALQRIREQRGLSRNRLATVSGKDRATLWRWETGRQQPDLRTIGQLANALGCHPTALIEWAEDDQ
ncbi:MULTISPECIES: helix-turn-helix domain-containing protein [Nocardiopsis]|uniref:HTH cro/C1-type domain-containing protein n=1 Tax=Nocardiopsis sinuspersici TaxID=501010 RepID=A0A1V3BWH5_9ACTN|nr:MULTISPECIES: helix-turn-helix transcriptional regulator [Nocardiopsis]OOC52609.1 hypothetical protein NOSIN_01175 [Nocardiopsis sinuspersici]